MCRAIVLLLFAHPTSGTEEIELLPNHTTLISGCADAEADGAAVLRVGRCTSAMWQAIAPGQVHNITVKAEKDAEALAAQRDTIIETYIKEGSDFQINLPSTLAKSLVEKAKTECGLTLFEEAREEIFKLMKRDTLPRYKTSDGFETLVSGLGEPMPIPDCEVPTSLESVRTKFLAS